jgi:hypothetical protein
MIKLIFLISLLTTFNLAHSQVDTTTIGGIRVFDGLVATGPCETIVKKNKIYEIQIGETFHRTVLANGWFKKVGDNCYKNTWIQSMVNKEFYLNSEGIYLNFKKGKPYSGKIREDDGKFKIIGRCKKGHPNGKFVILDIKNNVIIWEGVIELHNE